MEGSQAHGRAEAVERSALLDELFRALLEELMTGRLSVAGAEVGDGE